MHNHSFPVDLSLGKLALNWTAGTCAAVIVELRLQTCMAQARSHDTNQS